jgi:CBS domain containing-hemolysin-like protein
MKKILTVINSVCSLILNLIGLVLYLIMNSALWSLFVQWLWNSVVPDVFHLSQITWGQAFLLALLLAFLFAFLFPKDFNLAKATTETPKI